MNDMTAPVILVCGSRDYPLPKLIGEVVGEFNPETIVVEGGARGVDLWARHAAQARGLHVAEVKALWERGRSAGHKRNAAMLRLGVTMVVAFWDGKSPGTKGMIERACAAGIPVSLYREDGSHSMLVVNLLG